jgi:hypothetical protein
MTALLPLGKPFRGGRERFVGFSIPVQQFFRRRVDSAIPRST